MTSKAFYIFLFLAFAFTTTALAQQWIHVEVVEEGEMVNVNLPMSLMAAAMAIIPEEIKEETEDEMRVGLNELNLEWADLQKL